MHSSRLISIVVPVYNEERNLETLFEKIQTTLDRLDKFEWEIIFINDGSADKSWAILSKLSEGNQKIKLINFIRNYGQTAAMMAGIDFAQGEIIIPIDADLQNDPEDIPKLLEKLDEGYDVCSGWRKYRKDHSLRRNLPSKIANWLISKVTGVKLNDYGCSLKAYKKNVLKDVKLYGEMHRFIPIYASWHGAKVTQIPVNHYPRIYGKSNYGLERVFKVFLDLLLVSFFDRYSQKPIYVFGGFGLGSLFLSMVFFIWAVYLKLFCHVSFTRTPLPTLVVFLTMIGIICILMGLLAEVLIRTWHESQNKSIYTIKETKNFCI